MNKKPNLLGVIILLTIITIVSIVTFIYVENIKDDNLETNKIFNFKYDSGMFVDKEAVLLVNPINKIIINNSSYHNNYSFYECLQNITIAVKEKIDLNDLYVIYGKVKEDNNNIILIGDEIRKY